jgi:hypothetical protein
MTTDITIETDLDPDELRKAARASRRAFAASPLSRFVNKMQECMRDYLKAREQGVSREDAVKGIEEVIRDVWPKRPSKFQTCVGCDDTGWRLVECNHGLRCGRERCSWGDTTWVHDFVVACECAKGEPFRRSGQKRQPRGEDDLSEVGKTRKRKSGFSRFGT